MSKKNKKGITGTELPSDTVDIREGGSTTGPVDFSYNTKTKKYLRGDGSELPEYLQSTVRKKYNDGGTGITGPSTTDGPYEMPKKSTSNGTMGPNITDGPYETPNSLKSNPPNKTTSTDPYEIAKKPKSKEPIKPTTPIEELYKVGVDDAYGSIFYDPKTDQYGSLIKGRFTYLPKQKDKYSNEFGTKPYDINTTQPTAPTTNEPVQLPKELKTKKTKENIKGGSGVTQTPLQFSTDTPDFSLRNSLTNDFSTDVKKTDKYGQQSNDQQFYLTQTVGDKNGDPVLSKDGKYIHYYPTFQNDGRHDLKASDDYLNNLAGTPIIKPTTNQPTTPTSQPVQLPFNWQNSQGEEVNNMPVDNTSYNPFNWQNSQGQEVNNMPIDNTGSGLSQPVQLPKELQRSSNNFIGPSQSTFDVSDISFNANKEVAPSINNPIANLLRNNSSQNPANNYNDINNTDFFTDAVPGVQAESTYYPGTEPTVQAAPARYFGYTPIFQGGKTLYPQGTADARKKALQDAAKEAAKKKKDLQDTTFNALKMVNGLPAYQDKINQEYQDNIFNMYEGLVKKYGKDKFVEKMNDPTDRDRFDILKKYHEYETHALATTNANTAFETLLKSIKAGETTPGSGTNDLISKFYSGKMSLKDITNIPTALATYQTMDKKITSLKDVIGKDLATTYAKGGVPLSYGEMIRKIETQGIPDYKLDEYVNLFASDYSLDIMDRDPAMIKKYLQTYIPNIIKETFNINKEPKGTTVNINNGDANKPQTDLLFNENKNIGLYFAGTTNGVPDDNKREYANLNLEGITFDKDLQKEYSVNVGTITKDNSFESKEFKNDFINYWKGDIPYTQTGMVKMPVDKNGHINTGGKETKYFMILQYNPPKLNIEDVTGLSSDELLEDKNQAKLAEGERILKVVNKDMTHYVPYESVRNATGVYVKDDGSVSTEVINKKNVYTKEKKVNVTGTTQFTVNGIVYNIPNNEVAEFKKDNNIP